MDNKQNRQFYWEVKQFINGNNTPKAPEVKNPSVKDAISGVLGENSVYRQNTFNKNIGTNEVVRSYLNVLGSTEKKNDPGTVMYTKNAISNPFNILHEADQRVLNVPDTTDGAPAKRWRDPKYAEIQKHMDKVKAEQEELKAIRKKSREKGETEQFKKELGRYSIQVPDQPNAAKMLAALTPQQRKDLESARARSDADKLTALSTIDIKDLSSDELYDLKRIQKAQARKEAEQKTGGFVLSGPTEAEQEEERRLAPVKQFIGKSVQRFKDEAAQKVRTSPISPGYSSVTPESFETAYNAMYYPRNPTHGRMLQALHGQNTGKAIEGAGTVEGWKTVMDVQAADAEAAEREKRHKEEMEASSQRVIAADNELRRWRGLSKKEQAAEAIKEFEDSPEGQKIISQANFDKTVMDAKFAMEDENLLSAYDKMNDARRGMAQEEQLRQQEKARKDAMERGTGRPADYYRGKAGQLAAEELYRKYHQEIDSRTYRNADEFKEAERVGINKLSKDMPAAINALDSFMQRIFPDAKFEAEKLRQKEKAEAGLNTPVEVPDPTQASRGMSQRAVASRAATMFGSGRSALDSTRRMNA